MSLPEPRLAAAEAEVARLRQALRDRDSEIVQEQIGDDALAEVERLREALEDAIGWIEPSLGGANAAQRARAALAASRTERAVMPNMRAPEPQPRNMTQTEGEPMPDMIEQFRVVIERPLDPRESRVLQEQHQVGRDEALRLAGYWEDRVLPDGQRGWVERRSVTLWEDFPPPVAAQQNDGGPDA